MAWKKEGDTAVFDPRVLAVVEHPRADPLRSVIEVWGFFSRVTSYLAPNPNDTYHVPFSACLMLAMNDREHLELLWDQCTFAGLGQVVELDGGRRAFQVINDPNFVHVKTAAEIEWDRQRKADNGDPNLTVPVRMRDGDACRYCGLTVRWSDRRGAKGGTYDHRPPGRPATWETSVVACGGCNAARGLLSRGLAPDAGLAAADAVHPLRPAPPTPYWSPATREWLAGHAAILRQHGLTPPALAPAGTKPIPAGRPAPGAAAAAPTGAARPATAPASPVAAPEQRETRPEREAPAARQVRQVPADRQPPGSGDAGPGRDGSGRAGSGRKGLGRAAPAAQPPPVSTTEPAVRRRRGSRGKRGRGRSTSASTTISPSSTNQGETR
ncbi:hypothetical protein [Cellulomonas olei]|uniref:hypothetical protein n=1 Tax=Cellulomonas sp. P4 TaxID=3142533 RepID=UPI0031BB72C1